jgi:predicted AAA+ superfamily ATPase
MKLGYLDRDAQLHLEKLLTQFPAVVIVGARQIGKTTLAKKLVTVIGQDSVYIDLELPSDRAKLQNAELYFEYNRGKCVILDEVQREKNLFPLLRAVIDQDRRPGRFILLGSASPELIRDSSETLAGRVAYFHLFPFNLAEVGAEKLNQLWLNGGFPDSFLAANDADSILWRQNFVRSYLERDLPQLGLNANPNSVRRLWEILAHQNGQMLNIQSISKSLGLSSPTVKSYIEFMESAFLIHLVRPYFSNIKKRLVKSPKIYLLDTGILHSLLDIPSFDKLMGNPAVGSSFENFVLNQLLTVVDSSNIYFYRTADGTEMDFVITRGGTPYISIEVKLSSAPTTTKSFTTAINDLQTEHNCIVAPVGSGYPINEKCFVFSVGEMLEWVVGKMGDDN